jgi:hypothetical protein
MGVYYSYINRTKHEYFEAGDMGYGNKNRVYREEMLPLIGYLLTNHIYGNRNLGKPCSGHEPKDKEDFPLEGHWAGDDCELVDEYCKEYEEIADYEHYGTEFGTQKWTNISRQLFDEYNAYIRYWNNPDDVSGDKYKKEFQNNIYKMKLDIGWAGAHFDS